MAILLLFIIIIFVVVTLNKSVSSNFDQTRKEPYTKLQPDATIVNVEVEQVQYVKNSAKFKTTVYFSDGFVFITHKTDRDDNFFTYKISISPELRKEIIQNAIEAHDRALKQQM